MRNPGFDRYRLTIDVWAGVRSDRIYCHVHDSRKDGADRLGFDATWHPEEGWAALRDLCEPVATILKNRILEMSGVDPSRQLELYGDATNEKPLPQSPAG